MKKSISYLLVLPVLFGTMVSVAVAGGSAIGTMAEIVMHLNHYPTDSEKKTLDRIVHDENATAGERVLAGALMRMQHQVGGDDARKLRELAADKNASNKEREFADILLGLAHQPSASDKERLKALLD